MSGFELSPELTPVLSRFLAQRSPVEVSREGGAARPALWGALVEEVGVAGLLVPEDRGGQGATVVELAAAVHETAWCGWSGPLVATAGVAVHLLRALDPHDASGLQAAVATGAIVVPALHEDSAGVSTATTARLRGEGVTGSRLVVDSGTHADSFLVAAVDDSGAPALVLVDGADAETRVTDAVDPGRGLASVVLEDARAVVVAAGDPVPAAIADAWRLGALLVAADALGSAGRVLELARDYSLERQQFGRPVASFQSIKHKLVDMFAELETARSMVRHAVDEAASAAPGWQVAASAAKARACDAAMFVAREGVQVHGGIGFTWEHEVSHHFRRVTTTRALYGTPAHHRALVAHGLGF